MPDVNGYFIMVEHLSCETMKDFLEVLVKGRYIFLGSLPESNYQVKEEPRNLLLKAL